jgi:hypothetical protein
MKEYYKHPENFRNDQCFHEYNRICNGFVRNEVKKSCILKMQLPCPNS